MSILVKGIDLPKCCDDCFALDDSGDYPFCLITQEQKGYNFHKREKRMDKCPFVEVETLHNRIIKDKYDCSKTLNYSREKNRMCKTYHCCNDGCPLRGLYCQGDITQEKIDIVQKWSNEHPEKTRKEAYLEIFPKLEALNDKCVCFDDCFPCFWELLGKGGCDYLEKTCGECWNEPYNNEFEKARENKND